MNSTHALLLRRTRLSDTSLIVTWFTLDHGRIRTAARGARRPKSPFAGKLDLFYQCDVQFIRSRRSDLHTLREVQLLHPFEGIRRQYRRAELAAYFSELTGLVTELDHPVPEIYGLLLRAFHYLETHDATKRALLHFESELAKILGLSQEPSPASAIGHVAGRLPSARKRLLTETGLP